MSWRKRALYGALGAMVLLFLAFAVTYAFIRIPSPDDVVTAQAVEVIDMDGKRIGRIDGGADRVSIPLDDMPEHFRDAVIAIEDRTFYSHSGIAPLSILRAAFTNVRERRAAQGGSTITQQYVKNAFVGNERSIARKAKEAVLALKLDRTWTKDQILEAYLNTIYLGRGAYGVEAAARSYFGHPAKRLTLAESALLAGIIRAPETYEPDREPKLARERRDVVLDQMAAQELIGERRARRAMREPVRVLPRRVGGLAPHFLEDVRKFLEAELGPRALYAGGVTIQVTLDKQAQRAAVRAVREVYDRRRDPQASLVAIDPATGAVRAMVGGRDFARMQFNLATQARRQPGSAFKTAVLTTAVVDGMRPTRRFDAPARITIDAQPEPWTVWNYDRASHGRPTVARATELSVNTVYAQIIDRVGPQAVADLASQMGIISELDPVPSLTLGTSGVTTLELTSLYATLAARGRWHEPYLVERVTSAEGDVLFEASTAGVRAVEQRVADTVNQVLQGVISRGTGAAANIGRPAAGKTGTTENFRDAVFAGYTPDLAAVVWNGYPNRKTLQDVRGINVTGGSFPAQIWAGFMRAALADVPASSFPEPAPEERPTQTVTPSSTATDSPTASPSPTESKSKSPSPSESESESESPSPSPSESGSESPSPSPSESES